MVSEYGHLTVFPISSSKYDQFLEVFRLTTKVLLRYGVGAKSWCNFGAEDVTGSKRKLWNREDEGKIRENWSKYGKIYTYKRWKNIGKKMCLKCKVPKYWRITGSEKTISGGREGTYVWWYPHIFYQTVIDTPEKYLLKHNYHLSNN